MNIKKIEVKTIDFNVPGAGTIRISEENIFRCGGKPGFSFGVSWGACGFFGGTLPNDEALRLANHIIKTLNK